MTGLTRPAMLNPTCSNVVLFLSCPFRRARAPPCSSWTSLVPLVVVADCFLLLYVLHASSWHLGRWVTKAESNRVLAEIKTMSTRARRLLHAMPYCMSLTQRMRVFEHLVKADKQKHQPENTPGVPIRVRRWVNRWGRSQSRGATEGGG